jgi:hypothetical protein
MIDRFGLNLKKEVKNNEWRLEWGWIGLIFNLVFWVVQMFERRPEMMMGLDLIFLWRN